MRKIILSIFVATLFAGSAHAIIIDLTSYATKGNGGGSETIRQWVEDAATAYNLLPTPPNIDLPLPVVEDFKNNQNDDNGFSGSTTFGNNITNLNIALMGHQYVALHWGGPTGYKIYYTGGETSFSAVNPLQQGLSWYTLYNKGNTSVPDSGSTLLLLGLGLGLLGFLRRRK